MKIEKELQGILDVLKEQWPIAEIKLRAALLEREDTDYRAEIIQEAFIAMNTSIPLIRRWTNINSSMGPDLQNAWNVLSSFLAKYPAFQNRYLESRK